MKNKNQIIIMNIYYMLSYAYHTLQEQDKVDVEGEKFDHIYDLFSAILIKGISNLLKRGIYKEYVENSEERMFLRGKIEFSESLKRQTLRNHRLICTYDEFSEDIYMNQIIKTVAYALIQNAEVKKENKALLKKLMINFSNVKLLQLSEIHVNQLCYHKNNKTYQMLINICYLTIHKMLLTTTEGNLTVTSYLDEKQMYYIYEKFILEYYKKWYKQYNPASKKIKWDVVGNSYYLPNMKTDIMLKYDEKVLIIDAKYYNKVMTKYYEKEMFHSNNLYQIFAYVKNQDKEQKGNVSGVLLYAQTDEGEMDYKYTIGGNVIHIMSLNLAKDFDIIKGKLDSLIQFFHSS